MLYTSNIDLRLKVEGKDAIDRFAEERANFIKDTCTEISTDQDYEWLMETITYTVPATKTDWIDLEKDYYGVQAIGHLKVGGTQTRYFDYVDENDYFYQSQKIQTDGLGRYRLRWNETKNLFQFALINGPDAGETVSVLVKKFYQRPEDFPDFMEEIIVKGALMRFLEFLEGDDLAVAQMIMNRYNLMAKQKKKLGDEKIATRQPRRTKTHKELTQSKYNQYRSSN